VGTVRRIAKKHWQVVEPKEVNHVMALSEELLKTGLSEHSIVAYQWMRLMANELEPVDFNKLERWLKKYVNTWSKCDDLCTGVIGPLLVKYPKLIKQTVPWRRSRNRWVRRGSAVSLIVPVKKEGQLKPVFAAADELMMDKDDMVQKGYGWMLKEASNVYPDEVFKYVMKNKDKMPRVALRYAIEKLPKVKRKQAMKR